MRILVAGGTGAIGRFLVPHLADLGHEVTVLGRSGRGSREVQRHGARLRILDALEPGTLDRFVRQAEPQIIIHQLTAMPGRVNPRRLDRDLAASNRLRTEATDALLDAARSVGTRRVIAQSFCGWTYAREGGWVKSEDDPLERKPPRSFRRTLAAIRHLEAAVLDAQGIEGVVLRYGFFYGPGTAFGKDGESMELIRRRRFPLIDDGQGVWSFVHVKDAARATVAAVNRGSPGIYNIVDDEPAPVAEWLPHLASTLGAKPPRRVGRWLGRLVAGTGAVRMMTENRGASNAKAREAFGWQPSYTSWRHGFAWMMGRTA